MFHLLVLRQSHNCSRTNYTFVLSPIFCICHQTELLKWLASNILPYIGPINSLVPGDVVEILKNWKSSYRIAAWEITVKGHITPRIRIQHWFRKWLGVVRQQANPWVNVDPDLCYYMASLSHIELTSNGFNRLLLGFKSANWFQFSIDSIFHFNELYFLLIRDNIMQFPWNGCLLIAC